MLEQTPPVCEFDTQRLIIRLDLTMAADVAEIDPVVTRVMRLMAELKCAESNEFEVETALREALANAVVHGCEKHPGKTVQLCVACDEKRGVLMVVRDPGEKFDPLTIPSPVQGQCIYEVHGRGIYLINELVDDVQVEGGGTEIRMRNQGGLAS